MCARGCLLHVLYIIQKQQKNLPKRNSTVTTIMHHCYVVQRCHWQVIWILLLDSPFKARPFLKAEIPALDFWCTCYTHCLCSFYNPHSVLFFSMSLRYIMAFSLKTYHRGMLGVFKYFPGLRLSCLGTSLSLKSNLKFLCEWKEGELKWEGGSITCYCICNNKLILNCDGRWHLSQTVKVLMNHSSHPHPPNPSHSLCVCVCFSLFPPMGLGLSMWLSFSVCFSAVTCTCTQSTISDIGCTREKCSAFVTIFTFIHSSCHTPFSLLLCFLVSAPVSETCLVFLLALLTAGDV